MIHAACVDTVAVRSRRIKSVGVEYRSEAGPGDAVSSASGSSMLAADAVGAAPGILSPLAADGPRCEPGASTQDASTSPSAYATHDVWEAHLTADAASRSETHGSRDVTNRIARKPAVSTDRTKTDPDVDVALDVDHGLVERARAGEARAFQELVTRYQSRAFSVALGVVGRKEDAEDVVQEAFLKAFRNLGSFRGQSSFYTWLYRIVFNLAIDLSRRRYRHAESSIGDAGTMDAVAQHKPQDAGELFGGIRGPEDELARVALGKKLNEAIESLSPNHRAVIILREIEGLSYSEISDVVGCSKGTVMSRLHHARKRLQRALAEFATWRRAETGEHHTADIDGEDESADGVEGADDDSDQESSEQVRR